MDTPHAVEARCVASRARNGHRTAVRLHRVPAEVWPPRTPLAQHRATPWIRSRRAAPWYRAQTNTRCQVAPFTIEPGGEITTPC